jgi:hypothetical protein
MTYCCGVVTLTGDREMTQKHTPEPWKLYRNDQSVGDVVGHAVCDVWPRGDDHIASEEGKANARRIVACVNACRGLPTDELEAKGVVSAVGNQLLDMDRKLHKAEVAAATWGDRATKEASRAADLQAQVDELLAAAKHLLSNAMINCCGEWQGAFVEGTDITEYCQPLQDAINKITGESK